MMRETDPAEGTAPPQPRISSGASVRWLAGGLAALGLAILIIAILGDVIEDGARFGFDRAILLMMRDTVGPAGATVPEGPAFLTKAMIDITALGGGTVLTLVLMLGSGFLLLQRHILTAALVLVGGTTGPIAVMLAKSIFGRVRPDVIDHLVQEGSASFPSGHAANSAAVYLTLALALVQIVRRRRERLFIVTAASALVIAIGSSRVFLGVHWPTDVLAGWAFGALWAVGWWVIGHWLRGRYAPDHGLRATPDRSA